MEINATVYYDPSVRIECGNKLNHENVFKNSIYVDSFDGFKELIESGLNFDLFQVYELSLFKTFNVDFFIKTGDIEAYKKSENYYYNREPNNGCFDCDFSGYPHVFQMFYRLVVVRDKLLSAKEVQKMYPKQISPSAFGCGDRDSKHRAAYYCGDYYVELFDPCKRVCVDKNLNEIRFPVSEEELKIKTPKVYARDQYNTGKIPESLTDFFKPSFDINVCQKREK